MGDVLSINRTPTDFVAKTRHLSVEDRGAYQEILDQIVILGQDENPPSLPNDDSFVANLLGWTARKWRATKTRLSEGPHAVLIIENGRISQTRIVEEIEAARLRIAQASKAGNASAEARRRLRERMRNGSYHPSTTQVPTGVPTRVVPEGQLNGNSDPNSTATSHESRVTREAIHTENARARDANGTKLPAVPPDFAAAGRVWAKLKDSALSDVPPEQVAVMLVSEFSEELVNETLVDCENEYRGKPWRYFEKLLVDRRDHPEKRPQQRRARRSDGDGGNGNGRSRDGRAGRDSAGTGTPAAHPGGPKYGQRSALED